MSLSQPSRTAGRIVPIRVLAVVAVAALAVPLVAPGAVLADDGEGPDAPGRTFATDFSDDEVGAPPDGWSTLWRESDWTVEDDPRRLVHRVDDQSRRALTWDEVGTVDGEVEVFALVRGDRQTLFQVPILASGEAGAENAYYLDLTLLGSVRINRYLDGDFTTLEQTGFDVRPDTWYRVVLQRDDDGLRGRAWRNGEEEPDTWQVETSDDALTEGAVGLAGFTGGSTSEWAYVGVGLDGEPAPRAPEPEPEDPAVELLAPTGDAPAAGPAIP